MIAWPATPDKHIPSAPSPNLKTTGPLVEKGASSEEKRCSLYEQSPATTYGETATPGSIPPTPTELNESSEPAHSLRALKLKDGIRENSLETFYAANVSEFPTTDGSEGEKYPVASDSLGVSPTPQRCTNIASKSALRRNTLRESNRRQREVDFMLLSNDPDPFYVVHRDNDSPAQSTDSDNNPRNGQAEESNVTYPPREDREIVEISGDNAQALLPPNACVFVANLVATLTDEQLDYSVYRAFEQFGKVYVKIKRDPRGMPYAFCQYENITDSERAIQYGRGMMINGRQCRTERAKVNRSLYLSRTAGGPIAEAEARTILAGRGDLEKVWLSSQTDKEMFRLPEGIWVMFAFFQDCRDAQALFKDNPDFRLEQPVLPEDIRARLSRAFGSPIGRAPPVRGYISSPIWQLRQLSERTSVFVGNLPPSVSQAQLRAAFLTCGTIRTIEIVSRPSVQGTNVFAFVEFSCEEEARRATNIERVLEGFRLRIELRESMDHFPTRASGSLSAGSPRAQQVSSSPEIVRNMITREAAIAMAISAGLHPTAAVQLFGLHRFEGNDSMSAQPMTQPFYSQVPYFTSFYPPQYGAYGAPATIGDSEQNGASLYGSMNHVPNAISQYQFAPMSNGQCHADYSTAPSPYVYPAPAEVGPAAIPSSNALGSIHHQAS